MTLKSRLILVIALMLPLGLIAGGLLSYFYALSQVQEEMGASLALAEKTIHNRLEVLPADAHVHDYLVRTVRIFDNVPDVEASLVSRTGEVIKSSAPQNVPSSTPAWFERALASGAQTRSIELDGELAGEGKIFLRGTPSREIREIWEETLLLLGVTGGLLTIVGALISWIIGRMTKPLENLASALSEVGEGNFAAHVQESGPQELATIYREFNKMALRLNDAELQNRALNLQLSTVQEEERADIARDLHDEIGPFLFAVDVDAQTIPQCIDRGMPAEAKSRASAIRQSVAHMQTHLKAILSRLRPAALLDLGLAQAVDRLVQFWSKRHPSISMRVDISHASFGSDRDEVSFRIIQEGVSNAVRHAAPSSISIEVRQADDGGLTVAVIDDGSGIASSPKMGFGLSGMRERVASIGGRLDILRGPSNTGTRLVAVIPAPRRTSEQMYDTKRKVSIS